MRHLSAENLETLPDRSSESYLDEFAEVSFQAARVARVRNTNPERLERARQASPGSANEVSLAPQEFGGSGTRASRVPAKRKEGRD
jgi:hypothetical protein